MRNIVLYSIMFFLEHLRIYVTAKDGFNFQNNVYLKNEHECIPLETYPTWYTMNILVC